MLMSDCIQEYPHHLLFLRQYSAAEEDQKRYSEWLQEFLRDINAFERLYDNEFSSDLLFYWREVGLFSSLSNGVIQDCDGAGSVVPFAKLTSLLVSLKSVRHDISHIKFLFLAAFKWYAYCFYASHDVDLIKKLSASSLPYGLTVVCTCL